MKFLYNSAKPLITHCSYCFKDINDYKNKLKSFAYRGFNRLSFISIIKIFKSHNCRIKIRSPINSNDEPYEGWKHLISDDEKLKHLFDYSLMLLIKQTNFSEIY